jgi:DNA-binding transcriptional LysR family regulator
MAVVGAPAYFANREVPLSPHDLAAHNCIGLRFRRDGGTAVWDLENENRTINVRVGGQLVVNNVTLLRLGALAGLGLAYVVEDQVRADLDSGELVSVLEDWCPPFPGYHLYYPGRRHQSPALALLVEALRCRN